MEIYFVDVGRGTGNVILLGGGGAIVIDCGLNGRALIQLLNSFHVDHLARLVVSHNDNDHVGGAVALLTQYKGAIEQVCFLQDGKLFNTKFWGRVAQQLDDGTLSRRQIRRLHCDDRPAMLYQDKSLDLTLKILAPNFLDNLQAEESGKPNATSGVLLLRVAGKAFVFAGDSTVRQWRRIREARGSRIDCEVLAVPHHAGLVWTAAGDLPWLYAQGVRARHAVVSLASNNTDGHPREDVIGQLIAAGSTVLCTQITTKCCADLEKVRPGVRIPDLPGASRPTADKSSSSGRSRNVACAGTVKAEVFGGTVTIHRLSDHQSGVDALASGNGIRPLCRR